MQRGYVKLWRKVEDSKSWSRGVLHRALLLTLLVKTNWKEGYFHGHEIKPGQMATSVRSLADDLGAPQTSVFRALHDLEEDKVITIEKVERQFSLISFVNWNSYQQVSEESGTQTEHKRNTDGTQTEQIKELKKGRILKTDSSDEESCPEPSPKAPGPQAMLTPVEPVPCLVEIPLVRGEVFRVTQDWVTEMELAYPAVDVLAEMRKCRAWSMSNPQNQKTSRGIKRFLNSWLAKAQDNASRRPQQVQQAPRANTVRDQWTQTRGALAAWALGGGNDGASASHDPFAGKVVSSLSAGREDSGRASDAGGGLGGGSRRLLGR